jgi:uncharacterized membrane protein
MRLPWPAPILYCRPAPNGDIQQPMGDHMVWFYIQNDQRIGPVDEAEFFRLACEGLLHPGDLVWNPSMDNQWVAAEDVPELAPHFQEAGTAPRGTTPNGLLMDQARFSLRRQWPTAVGVTLLYFLINNALSFASEIGSNPILKGALSILDFLVAIFITGPLLFGWARFYLQVARREHPDLNRLFDGFKNYWTCVVTSLLMGLYVLLAAVPAVLAGAAAAILLALRHPNPAFSWAAPGLLLLMIPAFIPVILVSLNYSQAFFILSDRPGERASAALAQSRRLIRGHRWKRFCLDWRFFGWALLGLLTCGIGFLWIAPYLATTHALFYDDIRPKRLQP